MSGAYPIDVDSDGRADLIVLRRGENVLLRGLGDCRFERRTKLWACTRQRLDHGLQCHLGRRRGVTELAFGSYQAVDNRELAAGCRTTALPT